jgi:voltage-gated potassium channel
MPLFKRSLGQRVKRFLSQRYHISADHSRFILRFAFVCLVIALLLVLSAFMVWLFERHSDGGLAIGSFWDGIWWAIVTIATVGYGDKVPLTQQGRVVGIMLIVVGFSLLSVFTGLIASLFVEDRMKGARGLKQIRTHDHIVVCGWNRTAEFLLKAMTEKKMHDVEICVVMNRPAEFFEELESRYPNLQLKFVRGEASQEEVIKRASVNTAAQVFILPDQNLEVQSADDRSIIITNAIQYLVAKDRITVQLHNTENKQLLYRLGITNVIVYDDIGGYILANNVAESNSIKLLSQLVKDPKVQLFTCPIDDSFFGRPFGDLYDHVYTEKRQLVLGLMTREPELQLESIFTDNTSAIDQFIKSTLSKSRSVRPEDRSNIRWKPERDYLVQENDVAIIMS